MRKRACHPREFRPRYIGPTCRNVPGAIDVGIPGKATRCAPEHQGVARAVLPTLMTALRGVSRIDQDKRDTSIVRFVGNEISELAEGPTLLGVALSPSHSRPGANPRQILQGNGPVGGERRIHNAPTDDMVEMRHVLPLAPREPFQEPLGPLRALALHGAAHFGIVRSEPLHLLGFVDGAITIDRHPPASQINAQDASGFEPGGSFCGHLHMQKVLPIPPLHQDSAGGVLSCEKALLVFTKPGVDPRSSVQQRQADRPIPLAETEDAHIIINRGRGKPGVGLFPHLQSCADSGNSPDRQIGREAEPLPDFPVAGVLHLHLVGGVDTPGDSSDVVTGVRKRFQGGVHLGPLLWSRPEFADHGANTCHQKKYITLFSHMQGGRHSSTAAEAVWHPAAIW